MAKRLAKWTAGVVVLLVGFIAIRAALPTWTPRIGTADSIARLETVQLGGVQQSILIRGRNTSNPVLLFLHGGPGFGMIAAARTFSAPLEERFVTVHWDQRGAGKSYDPAIPAESMTIDQFVADTRELIEILRRRFGAAKLYLIGHSWGSILGVCTIQRYPELFHAYVGIGQVVDMQRSEQLSYDFVLDQARKARNATALHELADVHPPYPHGQGLGIQRAWLTRFGGYTYAGSRSTFTDALSFGLLLLVAPEYSLTDTHHYLDGVMRSADLMWDEVMQVNFPETAPRLDVPLYFFTGRHDHCTASELAARYYEQVEASQKEIVWFEKSGHFPHIEEPEEFTKAIAHVLAEGQ